MIFLLLLWIRSGFSESFLKFGVQNCTQSLRQRKMQWRSCYPFWNTVRRGLALVIVKEEELVSDGDTSPLNCCLLWGFFFSVRTLRSMPSCEIKMEVISSLMTYYTCHRLRGDMTSEMTWATLFKFVLTLFLSYLLNIKTSLYLHSLEESLAGFAPPI